MIAWPKRERTVAWLLAGACALAVAAGIGVLVLPHGGEDRLAPAALPFGLAAAVLVANVLTLHRGRWLAAILAAAATLATLYGVLVAASVPLRLAVEGSCSPAPAPCPVGYGRPMSSAESLALDVAVVCGLLAVLAIFLAVEVQYRPRLHLFGPAPPDSTTTPGA